MDYGMETVPHTFSNLDIAAWASATGRTLSPFDFQVLHTLEQTFWRVYHTPKEEPKSLVKQFQQLEGLRKVNVGKKNG